MSSIEPVPGCVDESAFPVCFPWNIGPLILPALRIEPSSRVLEVDALGLEADVVLNGLEHGFQRGLADGSIEGGAGVALGYTARIGRPELIKIGHTSCISRP
jgi:hypothetical protein